MIVFVPKGVIYEHVNPYTGRPMIIRPVSSTEDIEPKDNPDTAL